MSNVSDEQVFNSDVSMFMQIPAEDVLDELVEDRNEDTSNEKIV